MSIYFQEEKKHKLRYGGCFTSSFFELGIIFDNAKEFRKDIADYVVQEKV